MLSGRSHPESFCFALMSESKAELDRLDQETRRTGDLIRQQLRGELVKVLIRSAGPFGWTG